MYSTLSDTKTTVSFCRLLKVDAVPKSDPLSPDRDFVPLCFINEEYHKRMLFRKSSDHNLSPETSGFFIYVSRAHSVETPFTFSWPIATSLSKSELGLGVGEACMEGLKSALKGFRMWCVKSDSALHLALQAKFMCAFSIVVYSNVATPD